jgi:hypothetical protein
VGVEQLDELGEVGRRPCEPVDLIDNDDIDLALPDVGREPLQGRALGRACGVASCWASSELNSWSSPYSVETRV